MENAETRCVVHLICGDDALRDRLAQLLRSEGHEAHTYESAPRFLDSVDPESRGCVFAHVRLADMTGVELVARMKAKGLNLPVIVCADPGEESLAIQAMKEGAADFIEKPVTDEALLRAVRAALARAAGRAEREKERERNLATLSTLTEQERQFLNALLKGKTNETIAYQLGLSVKSVAARRARLMAKTRAESLSDLVRLAVHAIPVDDCA
jgi:two-component system, LuxR family, response regulator FixJ